MVLLLDPAVDLQLNDLAHFYGHFAELITTAIPARSVCISVWLRLKSVFLQLGRSGREIFSTVNSQSVIGKLGWPTKCNLSYA